MNQLHMDLEAELENGEKVVFWIVKSRALAPYSRCTLALEMEAGIAEKAKKQQGTRTDLLPEAAEFKPINTREEVAKTAGVSHGTLDKVKKLKAWADLRTKLLLRAGAISIHKAYSELIKAHAIKVDGAGALVSPPQEKVKITL